MSFSLTFWIVTLVFVLLWLVFLLLPTTTTRLRACNPPPRMNRRMHTTKRSTALMCGALLYCSLFTEAESNQHPCYRTPLWRFTLCR